MASSSEDEGIAVALLLLSSSPPPQPPPSSSSPLPPPPPSSSSFQPRNRPRKSFSVHPTTVQKQTISRSRYRFVSRKSRSRSALSWPSSTSSQTQPRKKKRYSVNPINAQRENRGVLENLYPQLCENEEQFLRFTHMSKGSFDELLNIVHESIRKQDTNFRKSITPLERLLLTLRFLGTGESARSLHYQFFVGDSTVRDIIYKTCDCLWEALKDTELPRLTEESLREVSLTFQQRLNFPHCIGAIDVKHVHFECPNSSRQYFGYNYNNKNKYSIGLQGIADGNSNFMAIDVGDYEIHSSDGSMLKHSSFGRELISGQLPIPQDEMIGNVSMPYVFIADEAYPLTEHIMRPYPSRVIDNVRRVYNYRHSRAQTAIQYAFWLMSNKWSVLKTTMKINPDHARKVLLACCVLHNFVQKREGLLLADTDSVEESIRETGIDTSITGLTGRPSQKALDTRDAFAQLFMNE